MGAAKVDLTPAPADLPKNQIGILDHVYTRAIVIADGKTKAALVEVAGNAGNIQDIWKRAEAELGIPPANMIISGTHSHSVGRMPNVNEKIFEALKTANSKLQPAKMSYGTGVSYINVNRNMIDPKTNNWWEGANYDAPSDKTVAVLKFETMNGDPIARLLQLRLPRGNGGHHRPVERRLPRRSFQDTSRNRWAGDAVALFTSGAAGDQDPIYFQQTYDLRDIRIKDYAKRGQDISNSMPSGGTGLNREDPKTALLLNQAKQMILTYGQMLGEEVLHTYRFRNEAPGNQHPDLWRAEDCSAAPPGRERTRAEPESPVNTKTASSPQGRGLSMVIARRHRHWRSRW